MSGFASHLFAVLVGAVIGFTGAMWIRERRQTDSLSAREFMRESYRKSGGKPTPALEQLYGDYLRYERARKSRHDESEHGVG